MKQSECCMSKPDLVIGYTTRRHLLLDLDNCDLDKAERIVKMIMREWPKVGDCLILRSSARPLKVDLRYSWNNWPYMKTERDHFHLVFNNNIGLNLCYRICETLAGLHILNKDYMKIREFRGDMTLRVSTVATRDGLKPAPTAERYIFNYFEKGGDGAIREYLAFRLAVRDSEASLNCGEEDLYSDKAAEYDDQRE